MIAGVGLGCVLVWHGGILAQAASSAPSTTFAPSNLSATGVRALAANCAACHGTNGHSAGGAIAGLAGMNKEYFVNQINLFKQGKRDVTVMQQIAKGYTDAEVMALSEFFAAQKK
ncbi:MAG: c-type cytochrome [Betaproteobacteria bacterium]|nr:c-type cytochrome [Betaproteobacteria bacterium]